MASCAFQRGDRVPDGGRDPTTDCNSRLQINGFCRAEKRRGGYKIKQEMNHLLGDYSEGGNLLGDGMRVPSRLRSEGNREVLGERL